MTNIRTAPDRLFLAAFCVIFSLQTLVSVSRKSATYDEPSDLVSGYVELTGANYWLKPETLPLTKLLGALPLLCMGINVPPIDPVNPWAFVLRPGATGGRN